MMTLATAALPAAMAALLQAPAALPKEPARDLFLRTVKAPGIEVRFVDYHWQPALFDAMEKGSAGLPEARRDWVLARVVVELHPVTFEGARLSVGSYALTLWPNLDGKGMAIELRRVDMREVFPNLNAMAPAPRGETMFKAPARFEAQAPLAPRLDMTATDEGGATTLTVRYGDKRLSLKITP